MITSERCFLVKPLPIGGKISKRNSTTDYELTTPCEVGCTDIVDDECAISEG